MTARVSNAWARRIRVRTRDTFYRYVQVQSRDGRWHDLSDGEHCVQTDALPAIILRAVAIITAED